MSDQDEHKGAGAEIERLLTIMAKLRDPDGGCPWDLEQNFATIAPYTVEEAYEVADAIEQEDKTALRDELGDLLFQSVFHAQMAKEEGAFDFADVARAISDKMIRRHPHVFGDDNTRTADEQTQSWEAQKAAERAAKGAQGLLDDVPIGLPAMTRAVKLQKRAARVGFDWTEARAILSKVHEETTEIVDAMDNKSQAEVEEEFGDLLFVIANLARHLQVDPEHALRGTNAKFARRFAHIEERVKEDGGTLEGASLDEMEALWMEAKTLEKQRARK